MGLFIQTLGKIIKLNPNGSKFTATLDANTEEEIQIEGWQGRLVRIPKLLDWVSIVGTCVRDNGILKVSLKKCEVIEQHLRLFEPYLFAYGNIAQDDNNLSMAVEQYEPTAKKLHSFALPINDKFMLEARRRLMAPNRFMGLTGAWSQSAFRAEEVVLMRNPNRREEERDGPLLTCDFTPQSVKKVCVDDFEVEVKKEFDDDEEEFVMAPSNDSLCDLDDDVLVTPASKIRRSRQKEVAVSPVAAKKARRA